MKVDMQVVKQIVDETNAHPDPTPDPYLNMRYDEYTKLVGHVNPYYRIFYNLARELKPQFSVELGAYWALTASHIAVGNPEGVVYTIDIHREDKYAAQLAWAADQRYDNLKYLHGWTWDENIVFRTGRQAASTPIDILYIDAWHTYEYATREWELYSPMLASEALVVCDDIFDAAGATERMVEYWETLSKPYESFIDTGGHMGIQMGYMRFVR